MQQHKGEYESGQGQWLVLLHGLTGVWAIWQPILALLEKHFRVLAITLPGHDGGSAARQPVSVTAMADQIAAELRTRGIQKAHLVGNSLGGWLALELARRGLAISVTVLSPAGGWQTDQQYMKVARPFRILFGLLPFVSWLLRPLLRFGKMRKLLFAQSMQHGDRISTQDARDFLSAVRNCRILPTLLRQMRGRGPIEELRVPGVPLCIAWGEHDQVIPFEPYGRGMLAAVPEATSVQIKGVGHVPMYDNPERIAQLIVQNASSAQMEIEAA